MAMRCLSHGSLYRCDDGLYYEVPLLRQSGAACMVLYKTPSNRSSGDGGGNNDGGAGVDCKSGYELVAELRCNARRMARASGIEFGTNAPIDAVSPPYLFECHPSLD